MFASPHALRFGRSLRIVVLILFTAASAALALADDLPPEVPLSGGLRAPVHQVPANMGTHLFQGVLVPAGNYLVEIDPYDTATSTPAASFTIRRASDRVVLNRLAANTFMGVADAAAFTDGTQLAVRVRDTADGLARIHVYDLPNGARRLILQQPSPRADDDFGRTVWFTENRVLVAAPGRDFIQRDAGAIYVFDRRSGRFVGTVGTGIKNSLFGSEPSSPAEAGPQPEGVPYVQVSGKRALIVHGRRAFRFAGDRLSPLTLAPDGLNRAILKAAFIAENRIILATSESRHGLARPGRVIAYDLATGKLRYQLRARPLDGSHDFPSRVIADGPRFYVHDASDALNATGQYGALHAFDTATGRRLASSPLPLVAPGQYQDSRSLALSGGLLWILFQEPRVGQPSITTWVAYDPLTLTESFRLTPPGADRFVGRAPQLVGHGRFAVVATRKENRWPFWLSSARATLSSSIIIIDDFFTTTAGVLLFDPFSSTWTHRLRLEGNLGFSYSNHPLPHENLDITRGSSGQIISVHPATSFFNEIVDYDTALPEPAPEIGFEGRLSYTLQTGYVYDLLRRAPAEETFSLTRPLGLGDGAAHDEIVPYADFLAGTAYRLDGSQISRRLSTPAPDPISLGTDDASHLAAFGDRLAVSVNSDALGSTPATVRILDLATRETLLTIPARNGPIALNADYLAVGETNYEYPGSIVVYDATTGSPLATLNGDKRFGGAMALVGDRLVATSVTSTESSGAYTHTAQVSVYSLPAGRLEYTRPLATVINLYSWSHPPPCDLVVEGNHIVVRTVEPGADFANAGRVRVLDLATGDTLYELASPAPESGDHFGAWLAADGDWLAVGSSGASEVFAYDLPTGELRHTLVLSDRPEGIVNHGTSLPRLAIDAAAARLAWFVGDDPEGGSGSNGAAYIFDLHSGLESAKVLPPPPAENTGHTVLSSVFFVGDHLAATTRSGSVLSYPLTESLAVPLLETSLALTPVPVVRLAFPTRRGVSYQLEVSADAGASWSSLGPKYYGNGQTAVLHRVLTPSPAPESLRFRFTTDWETAPYFLITPR